MLTSIFDRAEVCARFIRENLASDIDTAVVLGSGLGDFAESLDERQVIPYENIPDFARSTVEGHSGQLVIGTLPRTEKIVAVMQGRFHYYEGYSLDEVTLPIRTFGAMGVRKLVLTNAAGGVNVDYQQGDLMLIRDHINMMMVSPLRGRHDDRLGARFPDMTEVYSAAYRDHARIVAAEIGISLREGVYMSLQGPNYETPAEVRMLRILGADAIGMSTVPEAIVACQMGIRTLGISLISNPAAGVESGPINHAEVMEMGKRVSGQFCELLTRVIPRL
jgi:purine-nucleoside phosphorylase